jgi:hypothetical protein
MNPKENYPSRPPYKNDSPPFKPQQTSKFAQNRPSESVPSHAPDSNSFQTRGVSKYSPIPEPNTRPYNSRSIGLLQSRPKNPPPEPTAESAELKVIDCTDFFGLSTDAIFSLCTNDEERKLKAFYGETILRTVLTSLVSEELHSLGHKITHESLLLFRERYSSKVILSAFLFEGTSFPENFPEFKDQTSYWSSALIYAFLWESCPSNQRNILALHLWLGKIQVIKDWIVQNIDFNNNFPLFDSRQQMIYWKNCQTNHVLWKYNVDYDNNNCEIEILEDIQLIKLIKDILLKRPPISLTIPLSSSSSSAESTAGEKGSSATTGETRVNRHLSLSSSPPFATAATTSILPVSLAHLQSITTKLPTILESDKSPAETKIVYRNLLDFHTSLMPLLLQESKLYTETYGNAMNYIPFTQSDVHVWNELRLRHYTLYEEHSKFTWCGSQCVNCNCFLIRRKVTNKNSNVFILGLKECPKKPVSEWIEEYQQQLISKFFNNISPSSLGSSGSNRSSEMSGSHRKDSDLLAGKFTKEEFISWGFLPPSLHSSSSSNPTPTAASSALKETFSTRLPSDPMLSALVPSSSSPTTTIPNDLTSEISQPSTLSSSSVTNPTTSFNPKKDNKATLLLSAISTSSSSSVSASAPIPPPPLPPATTTSSTALPTDDQK